MRSEFPRLLFVLLFSSICIIAFSQENNEKLIPGNTIVDSLKNKGIILNNSTRKPEIVLSNNQSVEFLQQIIQPKYWNDTDDPFRSALEQLIYEASHSPFDSSAYFLKNYPYDSISISWDKFYIWEPLKFKVPVIYPVEFPLKLDTMTLINDNLQAGIPDSVKLEQYPFMEPDNRLKDTTVLVIVDTLDRVTSSSPEFPFRYYNYPYQADSIAAAVKSLLSYLDERDSSIINFTGLGKELTPVWLNSKSEMMKRFWLKNEFSDSVTVWIGNPARNTIGLYLERGVNFRRPSRQDNYSEAKINLQSLDNSKLLEVQKIVVKSQNWKLRSEAAFVLNQASLSNWVKGGESSISTAMDLTGFADYNNKTFKLSSNNFIRLKLGFLKSGKESIRKNLDLLETNSKLNHKAFGKFDFSGILLFKTQIARGYSYSKTDTTLVSKLMNPAVLTVGFGLDYKPNKTTSINFSPFSYKGTFVPDTAHIDQTKYGILKDRRSKNEPGASFMISNTFKPAKSVTITNRLQLFTNYINNPQNVDIDWEMIAVANLNWFTDVRLNTHLIFDDDTKTVELDKDKNPILRSDGTPKKTARIQFKEMIGFSLVFRF